MHFAAELDVEFMYCLKFELRARYKAYRCWVLKLPRIYKQSVEHSICREVLCGEHARIPGTELASLNGRQRQWFCCFCKFLVVMKKKEQWMQRRRQWTQHHTVLTVVGKRPGNAFNCFYLMWASQKRHKLNGKRKAQGTFCNLCLRHCRCVYILQPMAKNR